MKPFELWMRLKVIECGHRTGTAGTMLTESDLT